MINVSLSATHLVLHSRVGQVWLNSTLDDEDIEIYNVPAEILPRLITVGESYNYTADLDSGSFEDSVVFESIEMIDTGMGSVEAIKLVVFSEGDTPVTLWLGRGVGYMQADVTTILDDKPIILTANLTGLDIPFTGEPVEAYWSDTIAFSDGWRYSDWLGYFWVPNLDSKWINHNGLGWAYCFGNLQDMWMYLQEIGWLWSNDVFYPWMFSSTQAKFLQNSPASTWFFDPETGEWIDLAP